MSQIQSFIDFVTIGKVAVGGVVFVGGLLYRQGRKIDAMSTKIAEIDKNQEKYEAALLEHARSLSLSLGGIQGLQSSVEQMSGKISEIREDIRAIMSK